MSVEIVLLRDLSLNIFIMMMIVITICFLLLLFVNCFSACEPLTSIHRWYGMYIDIEDRSAPCVKRKKNTQKIYA